MSKMKKNRPLCTCIMNSSDPIKCCMSLVIVNAAFNSRNFPTLEIVISSRMEKSGPFRTRFSVQREVFSSPCPFFAPGRFFSHEERGRKIRQGSEMDTGRKKHSRRTEKKVRKAGPLSKRGAESALF